MILLDSNILIRFSRGDESTAEWLEGAATENDLAISVVTVLELLLGSRDKRHLREIRQFLSRYSTIQLDENTSRRATILIETYFLSHNLQIADALIAATALVTDFELATINRKDFRYIDGLKLVDYP